MDFRRLPPSFGYWFATESCAQTAHAFRFLYPITPATRAPSEVVALKIAALDAERMTIHITLGKGAKDRFVPPSQRLL